MGAHSDSPKAPSSALVTHMLIKTVRWVVLCVVAGAMVSARAETIVALMSDKKLRHFSSTSPGDWIKTIDITGIPATEAVTAMDFRPDGRLVVITQEGTQSRPYVVNPKTGAAVIGGVSFNQETDVAAFDSFALHLHPFGLVLVTETNALRRFEPNGNMASVPLFYDNSSSDGDPVDPHAGATPAIVGMAASNSFPQAQASVLYGLDETQNSLTKIDWDTGSMDTVAELRSGGTTLSIGEHTGFDISGATGIAYISLSVGPITSLLTVDLSTGVCTNIGTIGPTIQEIGVTVVDISAPPPTQVVNISTRSRVGTGDDVMIAGFINAGGASTRLIIRGLGPSLSPTGVAGALADPVLTIFDGNGVSVASNDNWRSTQQSDIVATGIPPTNDLEAAYVGNFEPGTYTAVVSGANGGVGVGLVEIYRLAD